MSSGEKDSLSVPTQQDDSAKASRDGQKPQSAAGTSPSTSSRRGRGRSKGSRQLLLSKFVRAALKSVATSR